jgi:hypothetical protein
VAADFERTTKARIIFEKEIKMNQK